MGLGPSLKSRYVRIPEKMHRISNLLNSFPIILGGKKIWGESNEAMCNNGKHENCYHDSQYAKVGSE